MTPDAITEYLLPPAAYVSQDWFDAEQAQLFERTWVFVGVEHDLANAGDFITAQVGRSPIVVLRGNGGELRAYHNMCRHRGVPLVDGQGSCDKALVCPYHRWNYGLDGSLRSVPQKEQYPDLDFANLGLHPVRCETWKTLVFVNLDADAEPFDEWMDDLDTLFPNFHPETLTELSDQRHEVQANWKLYLENHVDWLHLWYLHADSLGSYNHAEGEVAEFGRHWSSFEWWTEERKAKEAASTGPVDDITTPLPPLPNLDHRESTNGAHFIFPSLTLFTHRGYWMVGQVLPVDPGNFVLRLRAFTLGGDRQRYEDDLNVVMYEDYSATEAIQRAIASPRFEVGPLSTNYERAIMRFHQHYLDYVSPPA